MGRLIFLAVAVVLVAGCTTQVAEPSNTAWTPSCKTLGCVESFALDDLPVGADISFTQCKDQGQHTYRYKKAKDGWKLDLRSSVLVDECSPCGHSLTLPAQPPQDIRRYWDYPRIRTTIH